MTISIERQITCVERELEQRRRVYGRWVQERKRTQAWADEEIAAMEAVLETLKAVAKAQPFELR